jgi:hypothetical protein
MLTILFWKKWVMNKVFGKQAKQLVAMLCRTEKVVGITSQLLFGLEKVVGTIGTFGLLTMYHCFDVGRKLVVVTIVAVLRSSSRLCLARLCTHN